MVRVLALCGGFGMAACQWLIFAYAPTEATLGMAQKIFYLHLPLAWWGLVSFCVVFAASITALARHSDVADRLSHAACEIGVLFAMLTVVTGMFWARRSWGVWWTWDPRLSTALVMCFVYTALLILRGLDMPRERRRQICAVTGIVAFLDVPLVFVSARIWRSIHPAVFAAKDGGLAPEMKFTAIACTVCFGLLWLALLVWRNRQLACADRIEKLAGRGA